MSLAKRILGRGSDDKTAQEESTPESNDGSKSQEKELPSTLGSAVDYVFDSPLPPAYDMTRDTKFSFPETTTISHNDGDECVTVSIETPTTTMNFEVRIDGYTALFGEGDAEYISVSGYALNVYYPRPEDDKDYFVRRLYYYEDEGGVGGEQHRDNSSEPTNPVWSRDEHIGDSVTVTTTESHMRVYDWREQMLTHDKPTPKDGEVVIQYRDSPNSGGNRNRKNSIISVNQIRTPVSEPFDIDYIRFNTSDGTLRLYGKSGSEWHIATVPLAENVALSNVSWETHTEEIRPSQIDSLIWVRDPAETWFVDNKY